MTLTARHRGCAALVLLAVLLATVLPATVISAAPARAAAGKMHIQFRRVHPPLTCGT